MSEPEAIHAAALALFNARTDLAGRTVAVSAGGTRAPSDPGRYLGTRSSGRQGVALAVAAAERGAKVALAAANIDGDILRDAELPGIEITKVGSAADLSTVMRRADIGLGYALAASLIGGGGGVLAAGTSVVTSVVASWFAPWCAPGEDPRRDDGAKEGGLP